VIDWFQSLLSHCNLCRYGLVACVGGGCNAIGLFTAFLGDENVRMFGVEPSGTVRLYNLNLVYPWLESSWFQPLNL
jgi:hypothetical protein